MVHLVWFELTAAEKKCGKDLTIALLNAFRHVYVYVRTFAIFVYKCVCMCVVERAGMFLCLRKHVNVCVLVCVCMNKNVCMGGCLKKSVRICLCSTKRMRVCVQVFEK